MVLKATKVEDVDTVSNGCRGCAADMMDPATETTVAAVVVVAVMAAVYTSATLLYEYRPIYYYIFSAEMIMVITRLPSACTPTAPPLLATMILKSNKVLSGRG